MPTGCQMFTSASVYSLSTGLLSAGTVLRLVLQALRTISPEIGREDPCALTLLPHQDAAQSLAPNQNPMVVRGRPTDSTPKPLLFPSFPGLGMSGLSPEMGNIWRSNQQALPEARESLIQARAALPSLPSSAAPPPPTHPPTEEHRGLEKLLLSVTTTTPLTSTCLRSLAELWAS